MQLETQRLILREYTMEDFDALYEIMSDPETMRHYPAPFDEARTRRWIGWNLDNYKKYGWGLWAVVLKESGHFIGDCGITLQNIDGELLPEIGYHINKKYWRRGFAKEAARAVRDWVFENTNYDAIYSYMKYTNVASYSTAIANGMKKVKEYPDSKNEISYAYAISRSEWNSLLKFRRAKNEDTEEIVQLYKNAVAKMNEQNIPQWDDVYPDRSILEGDIKKNQMFVGTKNGKIAVCFVLNEECDKEYKKAKWICPDARFCILHRLCVNPKLQNQGIAGKTMKHIEEFCRTQKYDSIRLDCFTQNPYSRRLYDKCGYTVTGHADWRKGRFELREKNLWNYFRIHTADIAYITQQPRGIFTAVGKLVDAKMLSEEETVAYWKNREYFEKILPVPPFYKDGNPDHATTWFKYSPQGQGIWQQMDFYRAMCKKYGLKLYRSQAYEAPGEIIYEDDFQIAVKLTDNDLKNPQ